MKTLNTLFFCALILNYFVQGQIINPNSTGKLSYKELFIYDNGSIRTVENCVIFHNKLNDDVTAIPTSQVGSEGIQYFGDILSQGDDFSTRKDEDKWARFSACAAEPEQTKHICFKEFIQAFGAEIPKEEIKNFLIQQTIVYKLEKCLNRTIKIFLSDIENENTKLRHLQSQIIVSDDHPELKGLSIAIISLMGVVGVVYYLQYLIKGMDASPFWILLHFVQLVYLMIMLEVNQPSNLLYFLHRLRHCKLDLSVIDEFTTLRDEIINKISFTTDRTSFAKIDWKYGSVLINLAFYARIVLIIIIIHLILKLILIFKNDGNKDNPILSFLNTARKHISNVFYIRYCLEIALFLWTAIFIEFMSTKRDSGWERLSLTIAINILCFLLYFTFSFCFAFYSNNTKETYRGYYYTYFLMKRAIFPICLISFASTGMESQLAVLITVQLIFIVVEIVLGVLDKDDRNRVLDMSQSVANRVLSIACNFVFLGYLAAMFMFLDDNPASDDSGGEGLAIFIASAILIVGVLTLVLAIIRMFMPEKDTEQERDSSGSASGQIEEEAQCEDRNSPQKIKDEENNPNDQINELKSHSIDKSSKFKEGTSPQSSEPISKHKDSEISSDDT